MLIATEQTERSSVTWHERLTRSLQCIYLLLALYVLSASAGQLSSNITAPKSAASNSGSVITANDTAPNWILSTPDGSSMSLEDIAGQGKATVMVFWSTWCKGCKSLLPAIAELSDKYGEQQAQVVLLNVWEDNDPELYLRDANISFPLLLRSEAVARRYQIGITPGVVIVDKQRKIRYVRTAQDGFDDVVKQVDLWLSGSAPKG